MTKSNIVSMPSDKKSNTDSGQKNEMAVDFFSRTKKRWVQAVVAIMLAYILVQGVEWFQQKQVTEMQAAYKSAVTDEDKAAFAKNYTQEPLAGMLELEEADKSYREGNYTSAKAAYQRALVGLGNTPFLAQAQLGLAATSIYLGSEAEAKVLYEKLLKDTSALNTFKAEAAFQLAVLERNAGELDIARERLLMVEQMPFAGVWAQKANQMLASLPR